jgi:hypothetical protein
VCGASVSGSNWKGHFLGDDVALVFSDPQCDGTGLIAARGGDEEVSSLFAAAGVLALQVIAGLLRVAVDGEFDRCVVDDGFAIEHRDEHRKPKIVRANDAIIIPSIRASEPRQDRRQHENTG